MFMSLNIMALVLDVAVCAALIISIVSGVKRGLVDSLMGIVIVVLALIGAGWCASHFTEPVTRWLEPRVSDTLLAYLQQDGVEETSAMVQQLIDQVRGLLGHVPQEHTLLSESVTALLTTIVHAVIYAVAFLLLLFLLWLISNPLKLAAKLPVVRGLDGFGGGALGLLSGAVIVSVVLWALQKVGWPSDALLGDTYIAKYFVQSRLIAFFTSL